MVQWKRGSRLVAACLVVAACSGSSDSDDVAEQVPVEDTAATDDDGSTTDPGSTTSSTATETTASTTSGFSLDDAPVCGDVDPETFVVAILACEGVHDVELAGVIDAPADLTELDPRGFDWVAACRDSAEALVGGPVWSTGLIVLPLPTTSLLEPPPTGDIACWVASPVDRSLVRTMREAAPADALRSDLVSVFDVEVDTCFVTEFDEFGEFTLVRLSDCEAPDAELLTGVVPFERADAGAGYPVGVDLERFTLETCRQLFIEADFGDDYLYISPPPSAWAVGARNIVCSAYVVPEDASTDDPSTDG